MTPVPPPPDWSKRLDFDWMSPEGLTKLAALVAPSLPFVPAPWQLECSARLLNGQDVLCVSATGDGKSALMYIPTLALPGTITLIVSPTNYLESDMVRGLGSKGISAIAINSDTLAAAELASPRRDLWAEAATGKHHMIFFGPETMKTASYSTFILDPVTRRRIALFCVDEVHLVDEWGVDFRTAYGIIRTMRARLPEWTTYFAGSASVEPGRQMENIIRMLGFRRGSFHFEKRDCERHNVDIILREIKYACSGYEFRDLDWLIPSTMLKASDLAKIILYCETIELGHRIVSYLRSLLPPHLKSKAKNLIRHIHSLHCPDCKAESLISLYKAGDDRDCAIFVATAVLEVGFDLPDLDSVVLYPTPSSLSGLIQRAGRPARGKGMRGTAIVYIKKQDIVQAIQYLESGETLDPRLLTTKDTPLDHDHHEDDARTRTIDSEVVSLTGGPSPTSVVPAVQSEVSTDVSVGRTTRTKPSKEKTGTTGSTSTRLNPPPGKRKCTAIRLVVAAHIRNMCITRQINMIYGNPGVLEDCRRCSSCVVYPIPEPRSKPPPPEEIPSTDTSLLWTRPTGADVEYLAQQLEVEALKIWNMRSHRADTLFLSSRCFLLPGLIKRITKDFHLLTTEEVLRLRMTGWRYWDSCGSALWEVVDRLGNEMKAKIEQRHVCFLEKQRAQRVTKQLVAVGLDKVKRVRLILPDTSPQNNSESMDDTSASRPTSPVPSAVRETVEPTHFYGTTLRETRSRKRSLPLDSTSTLHVEASKFAKIKRNMTASHHKENIEPIASTSLSAAVTRRRHNA